MNYEYEATVSRVIDGDTVYLKLKKTFTMKVDFGFYIKDEVMLEKSAEIDFRLSGINAPEMKGDTLEAGKAAKAYLEKLLGKGAVRAVSLKQDKYGRWLALLFVKKPDGSELCVNDEMIRAAHAVPYNP